MHWIIGAVALLFALGFAACEVQGTYEYLYTDQGGWSYIVVAGMLLASVLAVLPMFAALSFRQRPGMSVALWGLFLACLVSVVVAGIARTGTVTDKAQTGREATNANSKLDQASWERAADRVERAEVALDRAREDRSNGATDRSCNKTCGALLTANVGSAEKELREAKADLASARDALKTAAPQAKDSLASRLVGLLPAGWATEDQVRLYQPMVVPVLTSCASATLMAFAVWCFGPYREHRLAARAAKSAAADDVLDAEYEDAAADIDDEPEPEPDPEPEPEPEPVASPQQRKALGWSGPGAILADFAQERLVRDEDGEVSMRDVLAEYEATCVKRGKDPIDRVTFAKELAAFCQRSGVNVRVEGKDAYLVGAALAS